jgi:hypothetical protein
VPRDEPGTCLCGHFPIIEHCVLRNCKTGKKTVVGNCCVKKFMGLSEELLFRLLRRIRRNPKTALNEKEIERVYGIGWITDWERRFCLSTRTKQNPTPKQENIRLEINRKLLARATRTGGPANG